MALLSLAVGALVALAGSVSVELSPGPQPQEPIRVISSSYDIDFPNQLVISLEAEADGQITEVTLFYRLGRQRVRVYGYPSFTPSNRVTASFRIKTSGASYIPSGVDIEYYYVLRDANGNTVESQPFSLEYKDPGYQWRTLQQGDLNVLWHNRSLDSVAEVLTEVGPRLDEIKAMLGLETTKTMKAVILNSGSEAGRSFPLVSEAARRGHIYGGFAFGELDVFVLVGLDRDGIVHEMTHLYIDESLSSPLAKIPAWLNEGLAMYFEFSSRGREATLADAVRGGSLLPLRSMGSIPGRAQDVRLFYAQSRSLVKHMIDVHGREPMSALFSSINEGKRIEEAVAEVYGISLDQMERQWKTELTRGTALAPAMNPGTVGTSLIIAGAVSIAAVVVFVRWLRHLTRPPGPSDTEL